MVPSDGKGKQYLLKNLSSDALSCNTDVVVCCMKLLAELADGFSECLVCSGAYVRAGGGLGKKFRWIKMFFLALATRKCLPAYRHQYDIVHKSNASFELVAR
jgi:hypothetical protein